MRKSKVLLSLTGAVLALSMLAVPASAHGHGGGHHGGRAATATAATTVYCSVCDGTHDRGDCPNYCGDCGYSHTGDCAAHTSTGHHKGHACR